MFALRGIGNLRSILSNVKRRITTSMNQVLISNYTYDEVVGALKDMGL